LGPLHGVKIIEMAGIGPGPFCGMLLSDLGAQVLHIERRQPRGIGIPRPARFDTMRRGRRFLALDLKDPRATEVILELVEGADALLEPFRPKVMERLGLGPDVCLQRNPRLVYGRMTGWGQTGPLASAAGHDLNYIALSGALHAFGRKGQPPTPPLNIAGDFVGAFYMVIGMLAAILEARGSGLGQVVDTAMADCAAHSITNYFGLFAAGIWNHERGTNIADTGAFFYETYQCSDGRWISLGIIEDKFYEELLERLGIDRSTLPALDDRAHWEDGKKPLAELFKTRTQAQWCELLEGTDACFAPVLTFSEAPQHPHFQARKTFVEIDGLVQPAPQPQFSRTQPDTPAPPPTDRGLNAEEALAGWKLSHRRIAALKAAGVVG
jgi:crotonobetainyl-CoA:carnitine CoA-transferase CaiB-like acyl-CoA transferase